MLQALTGLGGWIWLILGMVLMGLEMLAPGMFLIWLGLAALATGVIAGLAGLGWQAASLLFAMLAVLAVIAGRRVMAARAANDPASTLNDPARRLVGQQFRLDRPLIGGEGQLKVGDSVWAVTGPDMVAGAQVKVLRVEGSTLIVGPA
jgi:inner membrane protein